MAQFCAAIQLLLQGVSIVIVFRPGGFLWRVAASCLTSDLDAAVSADIDSRSCAGGS
jgi:hypothetical protein